MATFDSSGRHALIGWNSNDKVNVVRVALPSGTLVAQRSWVGLGYLQDLDSDGGGDVYLQVSDWTASSGQTTRVLDWHGDQVAGFFAKKGQSDMHMSVSSLGVLGLATGRAPGRVFVKSWTSFPFGRVGICGGNSPWSFTWLAYRVALAHCVDGSGASHYQFIDLRGSVARTSWLGRFWGIQPVGVA